MVTAGAKISYSNKSHTTRVSSGILHTFEATSPFISIGLYALYRIFYDFFFVTSGTLCQLNLQGPKGPNLLITFRLHQRRFLVFNLQPTFFTFVWILTISDILCCLENKLLLMYINTFRPTSVYHTFDQYTHKSRDAVNTRAWS